MNFDMIIIVGIYLIGLLLIGARASRKIATSEDFIVAGRKLSFWIFTILVVASVCSGMTLLGVAGLGFVGGWPTIWEQIFVPLSASVCILFFGTKLHAISAKTGYLTVQDYFAHRYYSQRGIRGMSALIGILVSLIYMVGQYIAISMVLSWLFDIPYLYALAIAAVIVTIYVIMGGLYAVAWTTLIQGLLLIVGVLVVAPVVIKSAGGLTHIDTVLASIDPNYVKLWFPQMHPPYADYAFATPEFLVSFFFLLTLGLASAPHVISNVFAAEKGEYFKWAPLAAFAIYVVIMYLIKITGFATRVMVSEGAVSLPQGVNNPQDYSFIISAGYAFPDFIGPIIGVVVLAAIMSTTDRLLLTIGSYFGWDLYKMFLNPGASDRTITLVSRIVIAIAAALALILAMNPPNLLAWLIWMGNGLMLACFVAPLFAGLYWRRATREGAILSMITGLIVAVSTGYYYQFVAPLPMHFSMYGFIVAVIVIVVVSLITSRPSEMVLDETMTGPYIRKSDRV